MNYESTLIGVSPRPVHLVFNKYLVSVCFLFCYTIIIVNGFKLVYSVFFVLLFGTNKHLLIPVMLVIYLDAVIVKQSVTKE